MAFLPGAFRRPRKALLAAAVGAFMCLGVMAYFRAIAVLPMALAVIIYFTYPLFTAALGWLLYRLPLSRNDLLGCVLVIAACAVMLRPSDLSAEQTSAVLMAFLAPLGYGLLILVYSRSLADLPVLSRMAAGAWGCFIVALPLAVWFTPAAALVPVSGDGWLALLGMMILASLLPQWLFALGAPAAGPLRTAIAGSAELAVGLATGWLLFAEAVGLDQAVGAALIAIALLLAVKKRK
jgi:drug/metabolite transporter (DMT)-like permease